MKEKKLWQIVEKFAKKHFKNCFASGVNKGLREFGKPDVICVSRILKDEGVTNEVISIEVKRGAYSFCKIIGQVLGYSVFSHRCYLAVEFDGSEKFTDEQKQIANKLGVGLIEIRNRKCKEVVTSHLFNPLEHMVSALLWKLEVAKCVLCGTYFKAGDAKSKIKNAIDKKAPYVYWLVNLSEEIKEKRKGVYIRRYVCSDCVQEIFAVILETSGKY